MNGKWVRALIDSSCSFSHIYATEICRWICVVLFLSKGTLLRSFLYIHFYIYIRPGSLFYLSLSLSHCCCLHVDEIFSLLLRQKTKHERSQFSSFPVVFVFCPEQNQKSAGHAGETHACVIFAFFMWIPTSFSRCSLLHQQATAGKCRVLLFFSIFLSATYTRHQVVVIRQRFQMNNSPGR